MHVGDGTVEPAQLTFAIDKLFSLLAQAGYEAFV
jgi:hypothetical protein